MQSRDFIYWLQGFFELVESGSHPPEYALTLNSSQTELIRKHLALVFKHEIDPSMGDENKQEQLNAIHNNKPKPGKPNAPKLSPTGNIVYRC